MSSSSLPPAFYSYQYHTFQSQTPAFFPTHDPGAQSHMSPTGPMYFAPMPEDDPLALEYWQSMLAGPVHDEPHAATCYAVPDEPPAISVNLSKPATVIGEKRKREESKEAEGSGVANKYADTNRAGVRFAPKDHELIAYLKMKYRREPMAIDIFKEFDVFECHPKTIQERCGGCIDGSWYVFSPRSRKYLNGGSPARSVGKKDSPDYGYWKSNVKEGYVKRNGVVIGRMNNLTFMLGGQPKGASTPWKIKEYRIEEYQVHANGSSKELEQWVLCRLYYKEGNKKKYTVDSSRKRKKPAVDSSRKKKKAAVETAEEHSDDKDKSVGKASRGEDEETIDENRCLNDSEQDVRVDDYLVSDAAFVDGPGSSQQLQVDQQKLGGN